jgi:hypothetical protein
MQHRRTTLLASALIIALVASLGFLRTATAAAQPITIPDPGVASFFTVMLGDNEVPGPGDPDGFGFASITLVQSQGLVCFGLSATGIAPATAAHIHVGDAGVAGPVVVPLTPPTSGASGGCVSADAGLIGAIIANPAGYYVNVHNADYPSGALRGQLG